MSLFALLLLAQTTAAPAPIQGEKPEPVCVRQGDLPPAFAKWNQPPSKDAKEITVGAPFVAHAVDPATMKWATATPSARPGKSAIAYFAIPQTGSYKVALSSGAWVDVVSQGKALTSTAHGHGPVCTGIRKIVDFKLAKGLYALQLAGIAGDSVKVMIVPA
ncbi:homogentisate 1,2-dioxygenase [Sphingomonas sp.]|uniref:homogentisate 1,2-dioxygenase n=1 Tax=Sphingomonas sp. TaxID=28214 RepID=UPI003D6CA405